MSSVSSKNGSVANVKKYEQMINEHIKELITNFEFYGVFYGDDLNLDLISSDELDKVFKLLSDITKNEKTIINKLEKELLLTIKDNKEDKRALKKLKEEFREVLINLDKTLRERPDISNQHTFKYHFARVPYAEDAIKKKKADISQLQLELGEDETTEELKAQYTILVELNLNMIKHETLGNVFLTNIDTKKEMYYRLIDVIDKQLKKLRNKTRTRRNSRNTTAQRSVAGKKENSSLKTRKICRN